MSYSTNSGTNPYFPSLSLFRSLSLALLPLLSGAPIIGLFALFCLLLFNQSRSAFHHPFCHWRRFSVPMLSMYGLVHSLTEAPRYYVCNLYYNCRSLCSQCFLSHCSHSSVWNFHGCNCHCELLAREQLLPGSPKLLHFQL